MHNFPYTNFHEMNLDWIVETTRKNAKNIDDINNNLQETDSTIANLTEIVDDINNNLQETDSTIANLTEIVNAIPGVSSTPSIITVGRNGCLFTKISDAVEFAKNYCTVNNRVLIVIAPGDYTDHINLAPNPGIDMLGYGAVITSDGTPYPECALYTAGKGTFVGIGFVNTDSYAVHVEVQGLSNIPAGNLTFTDCVFRGKNNYGLGVGMGSPMNLICKNCIFYTNAGYQCLYIHNNPAADNDCTASFINCDFSLGGGGVAMIDDAANMSYAGTVARLYLTFRECSAYLDADNWLRFRYQADNDDYPAIKQNTNIILRGCSNNNIASLTYYDAQPITIFSQYCKTVGNDYMTVLTTDRLNRSFIVNSASLIDTAYATASNQRFTNSGNSSAVTVTLSTNEQDTYTGYTIYNISPTKKQTN